MSKKQPSYEEENWSSEEYSYSYSDWIYDFVTYSPFQHWFADVSDSFLDDSFNLYGLDSMFKYYYPCLSILRRELSLNEYINTLPPEKAKKLNNELQILFLLVHQRFIQSQEGLKVMIEKFNNKTWGVCPRVACEKFPVLPYGISSKPGVSSCLVFCPRCRDIYQPKVQAVHSIDGCAFGPNFATLFISDARIASQLVVPEVKNIPLTVFGYKLSERKRRLDRTIENSEDDYYYEEEDYSDDK